MHKAIYLSVKVTMPPDSQGGDRLRQLESRVGQQLRQTEHHLTGTVKRVQDLGDQVEMTVSLEGEQEAPADFARLAIDDVRRALEAAFAAPAARNLRISVAEIREDTSAVDDLADAGLL